MTGFEANASWFHCCAMKLATYAVAIAVLMFAAVAKAGDIALAVSPLTQSSLTAWNLGLFSPTSSHQIFEGTHSSWQPIVSQASSPKREEAPTQSSPTTGSTALPKVPPKSLDDLLGVPSSNSETGGSTGADLTEKDSGARSAEEAAERAEQKRLERSLDEASLQDLVERALEGMKTASARLSDARDPGLGTQRIQEDVIKSLDRLLEEAAKQQKKGSGKSSQSKSSKSQDSKSGDPSEKNGQQQGDKKGKPSKGASAGESASEQSSSNDESVPADVPLNDATAAGTELSESRIEWGQLPARVRELVLQGRRDKVSTLYERLTREYYRKLAEEAAK